MRHRKIQVKLGRSRSHGHAMYSNMLASLVAARRIRTTERRARDLRRMAERVVTRFTSLGDVLLKDRSKLSVEDKARVVHAMRMVRRTLHRRESVLDLYENIAPRYLGRPGGYTRMLKTGFRKGDGARMAILEFVDAEMPEREAARPEGEQPKKRGLLGRLRRAKKPAKEREGE